MHSAGLNILTICKFISATLIISSKTFSFCNIISTHIGLFILSLWNSTYSKANVTKACTNSSPSRNHHYNNLTRDGFSPATLTILSWVFICCLFNRCFSRVAFYPMKAEACGLSVAEK